MQQSRQENRVRYEEIIRQGIKDGQDLPTTMIKQDQCGTQMSGFHGLLQSILQIKNLSSCTFC